MAPTDPHYTIGTKIEIKALHATSLAKCLRRYKENKKTRILVGTVLEVEIGPNTTALDKCRTFVVAKLDLVGGDMKVTTINIRSVKFHTPEFILSDTGSDGGERATAAATTIITEDTSVIDPVSVHVFKAPAPEPFNDEKFRVLVAHSMARTPGRPISPLKEAGGLVLWAVLSHVVDASTLDMPPPPPLPLLLPLTIFSQFLYLLLHHLSYWLHVLHQHIIIPL